MGSRQAASNSPFVALTLAAAAADTSRPYTCSLIETWNAFKIGREHKTIQFGEIERYP